MMRLICESCDHGYDPGLTGCRWCGALPEFAHTSEVYSMLDTECYKDYWLCKLSTGETFETFGNQELDILGMRKALSKYTLVTFNGNKYDIPLISFALAGYSYSQLKKLSDDIIVKQVPHWILLQNHDIPKMNWIDHIDLIEVVKGQNSLKMYGAKMHMPKLQDLPIDPDASIAWYDRVKLKLYCDNDLETTEEMFRQLTPQIELRKGIKSRADMRSKSDAQIAEALMKEVAGYNVKPPSYPAGYLFYYEPPEWVKFHNLGLLEFINQCPFTISDNGTVVMDEKLETALIKLGGSGYKMGSGGLHSCEESISHYATHTHSLSDFDVASYYPAIILKLGVEPPQLKGYFNATYREWFESRISAKKNKDTKTSDMLKIVLNGTFGKLGSPYSIFYSPSDLIQITVTGQLALLMLIESLELCGVSVVSGNTDGVVILCPRNLEPIRDMIIADWEGKTGFKMEETPYLSTHNRDVNSYINVKTDRSVKTKGAFSKPGLEGANPNGQICVDALKAYILDRVPVEITIKECSDITQFVFARKVSTGGVFTVKEEIPKNPSKKRKNELLIKYNLTSYEKLLEWSKTDNEYLGKVVRWYWAKDSTGSIRYKNNWNLVPTSDGCRSLMQLPDELPDDIDYDRYVETAKLMINQVGL